METGTVETLSNEELINALSALSYAMKELYDAGKDSDFVQETLKIVCDEIQKRTPTK